MKTTLMISAACICALLVLYSLVERLDSVRFISVPRLALEAFVVGIGLVLLFAPTHYGFMLKFGNQAMMDHRLLALQLFLSGFFFHYLFEITTGNHAYCSARIGK